LRKYEVERILDSQLIQRQTGIFGMLEGYGVEEDEWRLVEDVKGSKRLVSEFHHQNPEAPQHISTLYFSKPPLPPPIQLH